MNKLSGMHAYLLGFLSAALLAGSCPLPVSPRQQTLRQGWAQQSLSGVQWELENRQENTPAVKDGSTPIFTSPTNTHSSTIHTQHTQQDLTEL